MSFRGRGFTLHDTTKENGEIRNRVAQYSRDACDGWPPRLPNLAVPSLLWSEISLFPPNYNADTGMELPASPSSPPFNVRKTGEPGLAEWAQKIRALQRQVDEDEEEEHRKLEQEISASRLARVRRSAATGHSSLDPAAGMPSSLSVAGQLED
jgi:hypothetical protein